jgi:uncharacterized protein DUF5670
MIGSETPGGTTIALNALKNLGKRIQRWIKWADESLTLTKRNIYMLWTIIVILIVLWLLGFIGHFGGALIHLLLVIAVVVLVIQLIQGRRL